MEKIELFPGERVTLAAAIEPFEENAGSSKEEPFDTRIVEGDAIVSNMAEHLEAEQLPDVLQLSLIADALRPKGDPFQFTA